MRLSLYVDTFTTQELMITHPQCEILVFDARPPRVSSLNFWPHPSQRETSALARWTGRFIGLRWKRYVWDAVSSPEPPSLSLNVFFAPSFSLTNTICRVVLSQARARGALRENSEWILTKVWSGFQPLNHRCCPVACYSLCVSSEETLDQWITEQLRMNGGQEIDPVIQQETFRVYYKLNSLCTEAPIRNKLMSIFCYWINVKLYFNSSDNLSPDQ